MCLIVADNGAKQCHCTLCIVRVSVERVSLVERSLHGHPIHAIQCFERRRGPEKKRLREEERLFLRDHSRTHFDHLPQSMMVRIRLWIIACRLKLTELNLAIRRPFFCPVHSMKIAQRLAGSSSSEIYRI